RRVEELERRHPGGVLVVDAALLVQWDVLDMFDVVLVVHAPGELRTRRLVDGGFEEDDVRRRMRSQLPDDAMLAAADTVIENEGTLAELRAAVEGFWGALPGHIREDIR
ncbi:MAG: dephospho-CoA kinase, partial [Candidatus Eisenbacteria bacterium]